jgi:hypothetical protein
MERNVSTGTGIAVVLNVVCFSIDLAGEGGEVVANIPARSVAIAKPHPMHDPSALSRVAVTFSSAIESNLTFRHHASYI